MTHGLADVPRLLADAAAPEEFGTVEIPEAFRAAVVLKEEVEMFAGLASAEKDPRKSIHVQERCPPRSWRPTKRT